MCAEIRRGEVGKMGKTHKAKVFEGHRCTTGIHNALLDVVMPELSPTTWKLVCVLIRQTTGWDREQQGASYQDLMDGTGIKSKATIAACLKELSQYRYRLISVISGTQHEESTYTINREVEIDWIPRDFARLSSSKNEPLKQSSGLKNEPLAGSKNEPLKQSSGSKNELSYMKELINLKQEREREKTARPPVEEKSDQPFSPNDDHSVLPPEPEWTAGERFILKACGLWQMPIVETDWKIKQSVKTNGAWVNARLDVKNHVGGTPDLFKEFWFEVLGRKTNPRPDYVLEQWAAYDRWLIETHETHRRRAA